MTCLPSCSLAVCCNSPPGWRIQRPPQTVDLGWRDEHSRQFVSLATYSSYEHRHFSSTAVQGGLHVCATSVILQCSRFRLVVAWCSSSRPLLVYAHIETLHLLQNPSFQLFPTLTFPLHTSNRHFSLFLTFSFILYRLALSLVPAHSLTWVLYLLLFQLRPNLVFLCIHYSTSLTRHYIGRF